MEIFGIGPLELILIVVVALIVLGPKDMIATSQKAAIWLRKLRNSEIWTTTKEVMDIPKQVMKETGLDKEIRELQSLSQKTFSSSVWQPDSLKQNPQMIIEPKESSDESTNTQPVEKESSTDDDKTDQSTNN
jgi:Sec-independent protein translocase protein TatA